MLNQREDRIIRYLSGNLTDGENLAFEKELENDSSMKALFDEYNAIWQLTNQLNYPSEVTNQAWDGFQQYVKAPIRFLGFDWLKLAASILILAAFSVGIWYVTSFKSNTIATASSSQQEVLEDNTEVFLNANSSLVVDKNFNKNTREVWLTGEALFNVTKNSKPFIVHTTNGDITVLGTRFDVLTDENHQLLVAELYEGSIKYTSENVDLTLKPGERITNLGNIVRRTELTNKSKSWDKEIACVDAPLAYILSELKLIYNVDFSIKNKHLKEHYTVNLPSDDLQSCLSILSTLSSKKFILKNNVIVLE